MKNQFKQPIDLIANDQPTQCPFDGHRTQLLETRDDYDVEKCPHCLKLFNLWAPEADDFET